MQVKTKIGVMGFVLALVLCARAGAVVVSPAFMTGTSVENLTNGVFDAALDDFGGESGSNYWARAGALNAVVTNYTDASPAYEYDEMGEGTNTRNPLFDAEPADPATGRETGGNYQYLALDTDGTLYRNILPANATTNIFVADYPGGIYADTLVKFSPSLGSPGVTGAGTPTCDKVIVWLRETEDTNGTRATNLVVTAGRYAGDFRSVTACDYVTTNEVAADTWVRLTIRAMADVTGVRNETTGRDMGLGAPGYAIYIDGKPVAAEPYDIGTDTVANPEWLSPEARVLAGERRLFPSLARAGLDESATLSRLAFDGRGAVDDTALSSTSPDFVTPDNVFTLTWDAGVIGRAMTCEVRTDAGTKTYTVDATVMPRYRDFPLGTAHGATVTVTGVEYDAAHEFLPGEWTAKHDCTVANNVFTYAGDDPNPVGTVASARDVVEVGGTKFATWDDALDYAAEQGIRTLALATNVYEEAGTLWICAGDDYILDLRGYTLQGPGEEEARATVNQIGGKLEITDGSEKMTGRILPPEGQPAAVLSRSSKQYGHYPVLVLTAGIYDGVVLLEDDSSGALPYQGACSVAGGSYTNAYGETDTFYLEQYATNPAAYFTLRDDYWTAADVQDACIWCGAGEDTWWTTAANWRGNEVPGADDTVIFPRKAGGAWPVTFNVEAQPKRFWMDADVSMTGTNDFTDVLVVSGDGRFVGTGAIVFTGKIPGMLTGETRENQELRLGPAWAGRVFVKGVTKATPLKNIMGWGTAQSKVEFAGVRGYVSDRASYALPYGLVLTDAGETPAWLNETGYTGSTVTFPTLEGAGTFVSPLNTREILQVFQFKDVTRFTGGFNLGGKRLLLGDGKAPTSAKAGSFTFSEGASVRSALDWTGVNAHFGKTLEVYGKVHDRLMAYTGETKPDVGDVVVTLRDRETGAITTSYLSAAEGAITIITREEWEEEHSGGDVPVGYAFTIAFTLTPGTDRAVIAVQDPAPKCYYVLQSVTSLAQDWSTCNVLDWKYATPGDTAVTFEVDTAGASSGFYRVIVTGSAPNE